jgi:hypothetical protein
MTKKRPVVGVIGSAHQVEGRFTAQRVGERNLRAVAETAGALPLIFAGTPEITVHPPLQGENRREAAGWGGRANS